MDILRSVGIHDLDIFRSVGIHGMDVLLRDIHDVDILRVSEY